LDEVKIIIIIIIKTTRAASSVSHNIFSSHHRILFALALSAGLKNKELPNNLDFKVLYTSLYQTVEFSSSFFSTTVLVLVVWCSLQPRIQK